MKKIDKARSAPKAPVVTLKSLALHLGLTAGTVSSVLNNSPASRSIPEKTRDRIIKAARQFNYCPNFLARSLRVQRSYTVGVIAEEIGDAYGATVISGIETVLRKNNFFFLTVAHHHDDNLKRSYSQLLLTRGVEGIITIDTSIDQKPTLPTVAIAGHQDVPNVTNVILDHHCAAALVLQHLFDLGHRHIAFFRGPASSSDSIPRWKAIQGAAAKLQLSIDPKLVFQLEDTPTISDLGYLPAKALLAAKLPFTALFAYNDISAVGAMLVFREAGLSVPGDVSVVGFDDIAFSSFAIPPLTTIHQPLLEMGTVAAQTLLDRVEDRAPFVPEIALTPKLIIRESTGPARRP
jgi:LacI family transcriptional regulator